VHGDEPASTEAVLELGIWLAGRPAGRPVWVLPAMNPDGLVAGTKNSATDVDLNRNFPARNFTTEHQPRYCPGLGPLSEPETQALAALVDSEPMAGVVAVHAPFGCVNYDGPARDWAGAVAAACGWPVREDIGYPTPGSLGSWLGGDRGWPVLTLELPPGPYDQFRAPAQNALQTAINLERIR
jgi:protein MpaA